MRSGNFMVDAQDDYDDAEHYADTHQECGCLKDRCRCDSDWDDRD